jgi:ATP-binding cassette subfamily C protein/ATP-binding cassette subfamily C exporter for protease/lipase/ATP-binding cassette subfamily C protein EexD
VIAFSLIINLLLLVPPIYMVQVYDRVLTTGRVETLVMLTGLAAVALLVLGALDTLRTFVMVRIGGWLYGRLGPIYLAAGVRARLQGDGAGAQPLRDLNQIQTFIAGQGLSAFIDAPWVVIFLVLIWFLHPSLGALAVSATGVLLMLGVANELATRKLTTIANNAQIAATQQADTTIRNAEVVRAMGMLPAMIDRWHRTNDVAVESAGQASERAGAIIGTTKFIRFFVQMAILGLGAWLVLRGELTPGAMIAASTLLGRALTPVEQAMGAWRQFMISRIAYNRLKARLQSFPAEIDRIRLPAPKGYLTLENVTYGPSGAKHPVLQNISFSVAPGEALAVVGPSAGGKSTLCRLLVGLAHPNSGQVRLDGSELSHWDPDDLGPHIGYLPQDVELFAGSVRENIARMGEVDDDAVIAGANLAHAHDMIQRLPQSYETQIGDGGARLSGGQRQRIGLARAVYGKPRLIVLDEPNANLDQTGEAALAAAVNDLKEGGAALIIVGHRPSTLAQADKILLLKDGRVEMFGPRDEVLQRLRQSASGGRKPGAVPMHKPATAVSPTISSSGRSDDLLSTHVSEAATQREANAS